MRTTIGTALPRADFSWYWGSQTASFAGDRLTGFAVPSIAILTLNASSAEVGVLSAIGWLAYPALGLVAGAALVHVPRRKVMITGELMRFAVFATVPLAALGGWVTIPQLLLVVAVAGIATVFVDIAGQSYLPVVVPPGGLVPANANLQASDSLSKLIGPALAGLAMKTTGPYLGLLLSALPFLASALARTRIKATEPTPPHQQTEMPPADHPTTSPTPHATHTSAPGPLSPTQLTQLTSHPTQLTFHSTQLASHPTQPTAHPIQATEPTEPTAHPAHPPTPDLPPSQPTAHSTHPTAHSTPPTAHPTQPPTPDLAPTAPPPFRRLTAEMGGCHPGITGDNPQGGRLTAEMAMGRRIVGGLRFVVGHEVLRPLVIGAAVRSFGTGMVDAVLLLFAYRVLGLSSLQVGLLIAAGSVGGLLGAFAANRLVARLGTHRTLLLTGLEGVFWLAIPLCLLFAPAIVLVVIRVCASIWSPVWNVLTTSVRQRVTPVALQSTVHATARTVTSSTIPLGAITGGLAGGVLGGQLGTSTGLVLVLATGGVIAGASVLSIGSATRL